MTTIKNTDDILNNKDIEYSFSKELSLEQIIKIINELNSIDIFVDLNPALVFRDLDFSTRIEILKCCFENKDIKNSTLYLNILNMIKSYNQLSDKFFSNNQNMFLNIEEFLDAKLQLKSTIINFINEFTQWYFSCLTSVHKIETNFLDTIVDIPTTYLTLLTNLDVITISGICAKNTLTTIKLNTVRNAFDIVNTLVNKQQTTNALLTKILQNFKLK